MGSILRAHPVCPQHGPDEALKGPTPIAGRKEMKEGKFPHLDTLGLLNEQ